MEALLGFVKSKQVLAAGMGLCLVISGSSWLSGLQEDNPFNTASIWETEAPGQVSKEVAPPSNPIANAAADVKSDVSVIPAAPESVDESIIPGPPQITTIPEVAETPQAPELTQPELGFEEPNLDAATDPMLEPFEQTDSENIGLEAPELNVEPTDPLNGFDETASEPVLTEEWTEGEPVESADGVVEPEANQEFVEFNESNSEVETNQPELSDLESTDSESTELVEPEANRLEATNAEAADNQDPQTQSDSNLTAPGELNRKQSSLSDLNSSSPLLDDVRSPNNSMETYEGELWVAPPTASSRTQPFSNQLQLHQDDGSNHWVAPPTQSVNPNPNRWQPAMQPEDIPNGYAPFGAGNPAFSNPAFGHPTNIASPEPGISQAPMQRVGPFENTGVGAYPTYEMVEQSNGFPAAVQQGEVVYQNGPGTFIQQQAGNLNLNHPNYPNTGASAIPEFNVGQPSHPMVTSPGQFARQGHVANVAKKPVSKVAQAGKSAVATARSKAKKFLALPSTLIGSLGSRFRSTGFSDPSPLRLGVSLEGLYLSRVGGVDDQNFVFDATTSQPVLKHSDLATGSDFGGRFALNYQSLGGTGYEVSYFRLDDFSESQTIANVIPVLFGGIPASRGASYDFAYSADLRNIEFNAWRRASTRFRYGWGVRKIDLDETFNSTATGTTSGVFSETANSMLGGQFMVSLERPVYKAVGLETGLRFGVLNNDVDVHFDSNNRDISYSDSNVSTVVDFNVGVSARLTQSMTARAGYQSIALNNVASAPNQSTGYNFADTSADVDLSDVIFDGLYFGVGLRF